jgi:nitroreductase
MDTIDALLGRNSAAKLSEPAPSAEALDNIYRAALRAPDHARLTPWRFLVIAGDARRQLGDLFASVSLADQPELNEEALDRVRAKAQRAPLVLVVVVRLQSHPKVPEIEQYLSAGSAAHAMLLAAHAQGFAAIWRTGPMAFNPQVRHGLGLAANERVLGFLYLGTRQGPAKPLPRYEIDDYFTPWSGLDEQSKVETP